LYNFYPIYRNSQAGELFERTGNFQNALDCYRKDKAYRLVSFAILFVSCLRFCSVSLLMFTLSCSDELWSSPAPLFLLRLFGLSTNGPSIWIRLSSLTQVTFPLIISVSGNKRRISFLGRKSKLRFVSSQPLITTLKQEPPKKRLRLPSLRTSSRKLSLFWKVRTRQWVASITTRSGCITRRLTTTRCGLSYIVWKRIARWFYHRS